MAVAHSAVESEREQLDEQRKELAELAFHQEQWAADAAELEALKKQASPLRGLPKVKESTSLTSED